MRIIVYDYAGHPFQADLSRELAKPGHAVTHLYFRGDLGPKGQLERTSSDPAGLTFAGISLRRPYDKTSFVKRRFNDVAYDKAVTKAIRAERPDLVISGNIPTEAQTSIVEACYAGHTGFVLCLVVAAIEKAPACNLSFLRMYNLLLGAFGQTCKCRTYFGAASVLQSQRVPSAHHPALWCVGPNISATTENILKPADVAVDVGDRLSLGKSTFQLRIVVSAAVPAPALCLVRYCSDPASKAPE